MSTRQGPPPRSTSKNQLDAVYADAVWKRLDAETVWLNCPTLSKEGGSKLDSSLYITPVILVSVSLVTQCDMCRTTVSWLVLASLKGAALIRERAGSELGASWEELRMTLRLNHVIQAPTADAPIALVWPCEWRTSHPSSRSSRG